MEAARPHPAAGGGCIGAGGADDGGDWRPSAARGRARELDDAVQFAEASPSPAAEDCLQHVFTDGRRRSAHERDTDA